LSGSVTNSAPYTVASISSDGSSITVAETIANETDTNGVNIVSTSNSNFSYKSDSQLVFNSTNETIQLTDNASNAIVNAFGGLSVGMKITTSSMPTSSNNATFTISSISSDGSTITVDEDILASETDTDGARIISFGAAGTISANSYYDGDEQTTTHRVSKTQSFTSDIDGIDPAFEKGIRALQMIAQGVYGTAGGLDQNTKRVDDALALIKSSLQRATSDTLPFGAELSGNIEQLEIDIGYQRFQMQTANEININLTAFFDSAVADIENADLQSTVVKLLDDQVALEASYQAYSRISQLSLTKFL
jgi:flagellar hook-associated protein 3 FlgL